MKADKRRGPWAPCAEPPDGGWGWMVVCGSALSQTFLIPILQNFTLVFKDRFVELEFTSTDITTLVSMNTSFGMILGVVGGPLLKIYGYRKVALAGGTLFIVGFLCTGIAGSYGEILVYYGMLSSLGMVLTMGSFSLALNSYFLKNRSKAVGFTMTLSGLGPVLVPFLMSRLLSSYGLKWTVFMLSGLSLHIYAGALLLQPVKWHLKLPRGNSPTKQEDKEKQTLIPEANPFLEVSEFPSSKTSPCGRFGPEFPAEAGWTSEAGHHGPRGLPEAADQETAPDSRKGRKLSVTCLDNDDYRSMMDSTLRIIDGIGGAEKSPKFASAETLSVDSGTREKGPAEPPRNAGKADSGAIRRLVRFLRDIYDLDLLGDPAYVNTMAGLALAFVGEIMFSTMTPIVLREVGFDTEDAATFMSIIAGSDLGCRFVAPFAGSLAKLSSKTMYLIALAMLLLSRASMYLASTYRAFVLVSFALGIGKGFRSVYWVLVLPDCVPLSKLPSASAIQSLINGVLTLVSGPLIGAVIDLTGTYTSVIAASNVLTAATILIWSGEIVFLKCKRKQGSRI